MKKQLIIEDEVIEDEISIGDILRKLWGRRGVIIAATLASFGLGLIFMLANATTKHTPITLFIELTNIKDGKYPNGSDFSPLDLKSPDVIQALTAKFKLKDSALLSNALTITYGTRSALGLRESFKNKIAQKGLLSADILKISTEYDQASEEISKRGLEVTLDYPNVGISIDEGKKLTSAVPLVWNEIYTKSYRTIIDTTIADTIGYASHIELSSSSGVLEADRLVSGMRQGLEKLIADSRFNIVTSESGKGPADILLNLLNFRNIYLTPLMARGFQKNDPISVSHASDLKLKIIELDRKINTLNEISNEIVDYRKSKISNGHQGKEQNDDVQFSDSALAEILKISNQASLSEYLKIILESKKDDAFKRSAFQTDLDRLTVTRYQYIDEAYINESTLILSDVVSDYSSYVNKVKIKSYQSISSFYTPIGSPEIFSSIWPDRSLLILTLMTLIGLILSSAITLILRSKSKVSLAAARPE